MHDLDTIELASRLVEVACAASRGGQRRGPPTPRARSIAPLVRELFDTFGGVVGLARASREDVTLAFATLGDHAANEAEHVLALVFELERRLNRERARPPRRIRDQRDVAAWGMARLGALEHEELWLLALDGTSRLRGLRRVAKGGVHGASICASDPLRCALRAAATGFILVHNHPSGDPTPSKEDVAFTESVARAAAVVGVPLLDHVVVTRDAFSSVPPVPTP